MKKGDSTIRADRFVRELGFLLQEYKDLDFLHLTKRSSQTATRELEEFAPENPNIQFLIGCLPALFQSKTFFPTAGDIADFCKTNIGITLLRPKKKKREELIGLVVCEILSLDDRGLDKFTDAIRKVIGNLRDTPTKSFFDEWNEIIKSSRERS